LTGSTTTAGVSYRWLSGSNEIATTATTTVSAPGEYTLEVTKESTGCTTTTTTVVGIDESQPEGVTASNSGPLTCATTSVELTGSTTTTGVSYRWLRGSNEIATTATTTVSAPGEYTFEVTKESTGCTTTTTTEVEIDESQPEGVTASNSGPLTCETLSVELTGSTTTTGVSYRWLSGSSEIATTATTTVSAPGEYTLEVTKESTGCTTTTTTEVEIDESQPEGVTASNSGPLTCETTSVELTGSTTTTGVSYRWLKGSSEIATTATTTVSAPGAYTLEVTKESTGCTTTTTTEVGIDESQPEGVTASNNGPLTCATTSVELTGSTTTAGVSYRWLSDGSEIATTATTTVNSPGEYTLEVTKTSTGCTTTTTTEVEIDESQPEDVTASNSGPLTCETLSVELTGSTTTTGVSYRWLKGSSEIATTATTTVNSPGEYTLEVTKTSTGCTTTTTTEVGIDESQPEGVTASNSGPLTCETTSVELTGSTTTTGVSYRWLSGSNEIATTATTIVSAPGTYTLEVTKESTGCTTITTTEVGIDESQPEGVTASNSGPLTCETLSVELTGSTTTTGVSYRWLSGSNEIATTATTTVSAPGEYTLEVTKESTGCTTTTTTVVGIDESQPEGVTASNSGPLTCATTSVELTGSTTTTGVSYRWLRGSNEIATTATTTVSAPGEYTFEVTKESTGCTTTTTTEVEIDESQPEGVTASNSGPLTCETLSVELTGSTTTTGVSYRWLRGSNEIATTATTTVSAPGEYTLEVTKESTGCTTTTTTTVGTDYSQPEGVTASNNGPLTCETTSVELTGSTTTTGVSYRWLKGSSEIATTATTTVSAPGAYTLEVTKESTGCTTTTTTEVGIDESQPEGVTASNNGPLTCATTSVELTGSTTTAG
ncbi:hypothetical protein JKA74_20605, partial [Marivirga sp. S37H4]|nr:hypothetical protein [Marivirga aurantiaca]